MKIVDRIEHIVRDVVQKNRYPDEIEPIIVTIIKQLMENGQISDGTLKVQMRRIGSIIINKGDNE